MRYILPIIRATLKTFIRNKTSILLLVVAPLLLITVIFTSFNPDGLQKIPIGVIDNSHSLSVIEVQDTYFSYLQMNEFANLPDCLEQLELHNIYLCLDVNESETIFLNMHYDNTREPVIWEVLERIKGTVQVMQRAQTKESIIGLLDSFSTITHRIDAYRDEIKRIQGELQTYRTGIEQSRGQLSSAQTDLSNQLTSMESDLFALEARKREIDRTKNRFMSDAYNAIDRLNRIAADNLENPQVIYSQTFEVRSSISNFERQYDSDSRQIDQSIATYRAGISQGRQFAREIDDGISQLETIRRSMYEYDVRLSQINQDIADIQTDLDIIQDANVEFIISPLVLSAEPVYIPDVDLSYLDDYTEEERIEELERGFNLISLQTIFPTVLFLIAVFLSLLIGSFVCLSNINSPAHTRIKLIKRIILADFIATYTSALIIVLIPLLLVLATGQYLFRLDIFVNIYPILFIIIATASIFILIGMILAYLIKKESITLLLATFLLVLFIFLSGIILPLERMSNFAYLLSLNFPIYLGLSSFNQLVFYGTQVSHYYIETILMWQAILIAITIFIKYIRK